MLEQGALNDIDDEDILDAVPDHPIVTLRDLQATYGGLYALATAGPGEYARFLTPSDTTDLADEPHGLITIFVDLSGDEPEYVRSTVGRFGVDDIPKLGHSNYENRGPGIDHSITHRTGDYKLDADKMGDYATNRFTSWPTKPPIRAVAEDDEDGWIIDALADLGDDASAMSDVHDDVADIAVITGDSDVDDRAIITVRIKSEPDGEFEWVGDIPVLNRAMAARFKDRMGGKNDAESSGTGVGQVSLASGRLVGTPADPLAYYTTKQREEFPNLDADQSWRANPMSDDIALLMTKSGAFTKACYYTTAFNGLRIYYLPYFPGTPDAEKLSLLYDLLTMLTDDADPDRTTGPLTPLTRTYIEANKSQDSSDDFLDELQFYSIIARNEQKGRNIIYGESTGGETVWPVKLATHHVDVVEGPDFGLRSEQTPYNVRQEHPETAVSSEEYDAMRLIDSTLDALDITNLITQGTYFEATIEAPDYSPSKGRESASSGFDNPSEADPRIKALTAVLSGEPINVDWLLEEYSKWLITKQNEASGEIPEGYFLSQHAQLCALSNAGLLTSTHEPDERWANLSFPAPTNQNQSQQMNNSDQPTQTDADAQSDDSRTTPATDVDADEGTDTTQYASERRRQHYHEYLDRHPVIRDNPERRAIFALGALIGHISMQQNNRMNVSATLARAHPLGSVTKSTVKRMHNEALDKNSTYAREGVDKETMFVELTEEIEEYFTATGAPEDWSIRVDDLRFYYMQGLTYGFNNWMPETSDDEAESEESDDERAAAAAN